MCTHSLSITWADNHSTIYTIFIVDFLFDLSAGTSSADDACDGPGHLLHMRLPCSKTLWQAKTREEWEKEYEAEKGRAQETKFIDLVKYDAEADACKASLNKWMSQVDDFGSLVVSAASLADDCGFCC